MPGAADGSTKLTLCMIVRDEERFLRDALASVQGVVDAIVVVDTGSRDASREVARSFGATVVEHAWADDFAAARNTALEHVTEGFVLVLDADERLAPGAGKVLRAAIARGEIDGAKLPIHNADSVGAHAEAVLSGRARLGAPVHALRLVRRTEDLRWEGRIHENPIGWVEGKRIEQLDAPILHFGYAPDAQRESAKRERNTRILERFCAEAPESPWGWIGLSREWMTANRIDEALAKANRAWELVTGSKASADALVSAATMRALLLLRVGGVREAEATVDHALATATHPNLHFLKGRCLEFRWLDDPNGRPESPLLADAEHRFRECIATARAVLDTDSIDGVGTFQGETRLGTVLLLRGRHADALEAFTRALSYRAHDIEALLGRCEALIGCGRIDEALQHLEPLLHPRLPEGWILAALAGWKSAGLDAIRPVVDQALRTSAGGRFFAPHRREWLRELEATVQGRGGDESSHG